jgi:hypothetical protein
MQSTWERRVRQLASPQRGTGAPLRSARGAHSAQLAATVVKRGRSAEKRERRATPLPPEHRRLCEVGHGYGCAYMYSVSAALLQP